MNKDRCKLIFIHIPKCGGRSVMTLLDGNYENRLLLNNMKMHESYTPEVLSQYDLIEGHINYELVKDLNNYKKICILRDPLQRTISQFNHFKTMKTSIPIARQMIEEDWDFLDFVTSMNANVAKWVNVYCQYIGDNMGEVLNPVTNFHIAKQRLDEFDFIGLSEDMGLTISKLKDRYGLEGDITTTGVTPEENKCDINEGFFPVANWWLMPDTILYQMAKQRFYEGVK